MLPAVSIDEVVELLTINKLSVATLFLHSYLDEWDMNCSVFELTLNNDNIYYKRTMFASDIDVIEGGYTEASICDDLLWRKERSNVTKLICGDVMRQYEKKWTDNVDYFFDLVTTLEVLNHRYGMGNISILKNTLSKWNLHGCAKTVFVYHCRQQTRRENNVFETHLSYEKTDISDIFSYIDTLSNNLENETNTGNSLYSWVPIFKIARADV